MEKGLVLGRRFCNGFFFFFFSFSFPFPFLFGHHCYLHLGHGDVFIEFFGFQHVFVVPCIGFYGSSNGLWSGSASHTDRAGLTLALVSCAPSALSDRIYEEELALSRGQAHQ